MGKNNNNIIVKKKPVQIAFEFNFEGSLPKDLHLETDELESSYFLPRKHHKNCTWGRELFLIAQDEADNQTWEDSEWSEFKKLKKTIYAKINGKIYQMTEFSWFGSVTGTHPKLVLQRQKSNIKKLNK